MYRNQYDTDVTTFSPVGRLHQLEYAMEAVKQGSALVGLRSKNYAVLAALKRSSSPLATHQMKIYKIDDHIGASVSGLHADARVLIKFLRSEALNHRYLFESSLPLSRLINSISDKAHYYTQHAERRPFGVGLLIIGYDQNGPHLYETCPSSNHFEYYAQAIGARSQSAKTYLEKNFQNFPDCSLDSLLKHAVKALHDCGGDTPISTQNISLAYVGPNTPFTTLDNELVAPYF